MATREPSRLVWWLLVGLAGFGCFLALAAYAMRDNLFKALIKPTVPFQVDAQPAPPDYALAEAWATRPLAPEGAGPADVFFVHPTTAYSGGDGWNADIREPRARELLETSVLAAHASMFRQAGGVWAPRYRQAVLFATLSAREDSRDALDLAYGDVARAFAAFQAARSPSRPYVLAGIGQGGLHVSRLLHDMAALPPDAPIWKGLAAVYVLDQAVLAGGLQANGPLARLQTCRSRLQSGCLVSYSTVDAGDSRGERLLASRSIIWDGTGYALLQGRPAVCVNPLNGGEELSASPRLNTGSAAGAGLEWGTPPALLPGETGARCEAGGLVVEVNRPAALSRPRFELGTRYTTPAFNLFHDPLGADAARRVAAHGG